MKKTYTMKKIAALCIVALSIIASSLQAAPPDLTQGGKPDNEHCWMLGPTGARGWVWSLNTGGGIQSDDASQILITEVVKATDQDNRGQQEAGTRGERGEV
jgi:hypothetical protein